MKIVVSYLTPFNGQFGDKEMSLSAISHLMSMGYFPRHLVANAPGETYNTRAFYQTKRDGSEVKDFFPIFDPSKNDLALRPIAFFLNGKQICFDEILDLICNMQKETYHRSLVCDEAPDFRSCPVPYTGKYRNRKYIFRSIDSRNYYFDRMRSDYRDNSWKTQCKCRKAWMKHKKNASVDSLRGCCKRAVFEEDEALQEF